MFKKIRLLSLRDDLIVQLHLGILRGHPRLVHIHGRQSLHLAQSVLLIPELLLEALNQLVLLPHVARIFGDLGMHLHKLLVFRHHGVLRIHLEVLTVRSDHLRVGCQSDIASISCPYISSLSAA